MQVVYRHISIFLHILYDEKFYVISILLKLKIIKLFFNYLIILAINAHQSYQKLRLL